MKISVLLLIVVCLKAGSAQALSVVSNETGNRMETIQALQEKVCEEQQREIKSLKKDRGNLEREIYFLRDEVRRLNEILDTLRSRLGDGQPRPN